MHANKMTVLRSILIVWNFYSKLVFFRYTYFKVLLNYSLDGSFVQPALGGLNKNNPKLLALGYLEILSLPHWVRYTPSASLPISLVVQIHPNELCKSLASTHLRIAQSCLFVHPPFSSIRLSLIDQKPSILLLKSLSKG